MLNRALAVLLLAVCVASAGCVHHTNRRVRFDEGEHARYARPGTGRIVGQAASLNGEGATRYPSGRDVLVMPATAYFKEWVDWVKWAQGPPPEFANTYTFDGPDSRADRYVRRTVADGEGRFEFEGLPPGRYYVACDVSWNVPTRTDFGVVLVRTGSWVFFRGYDEGQRLAGAVEVREGETSRAVLSIETGPPDSLPVSISRR